MRMSLMMIAPIAAIGLATSSTVAMAHVRPTPEAKLEQVLQGRIAGKPEACIDQQNIRSTQIIDRTAIIYMMENGTIYVNRPAAGVDLLSRGDVLLTDTHSPQLCNVDTVQLLDQGTKMQMGSVGLGSFVPWSKG